jgi:hypothetical protein
MNKDVALKEGIIVFRLMKEISHIHTKNIYMQENTTDSEEQHLCPLKYTSDKERVIPPPTSKKNRLFPLASMGKACSPCIGPACSPRP